MRSRRGFALIEFLGALAVFTIAVGSYFALAAQKTRALALSEGRQAAASAVANGLEALAATSLATVKPVEASALDGEPGDGWTRVAARDWTLPSGAVQREGLRTYRRPHGDGLFEYRVCAYWRDGTTSYSVKAETLRQP